MWIADTFTSDAGWSHLESLVDVGDRMAGSDGERAAAEATLDAFTDAGAREARFARFDIQGWSRGESHVDAGGETHDCIALPRSPTGETTGELVDLGHGLPEDFADADLDGKVVMVASNVPSWYDRFPHRREKYYRAVEAGAAAFVFRNHVDGCLPPTGSVGTDEDPIGEIPAVGVSKEVGSRLGRRFDGEPVTVGVDAEIEPATSQNVHAELGPETDEHVLVTSHLDAHDIAEGAMDNGFGTATIVEVANALAQREDELDVRVEFVAFGAEEVGLVGSEYCARTTDLDDVRAVVNVDGVGQGRTLSLATHGFDPLGDAARAVGEHFDHPVEVVPKQRPHSDHWQFVRRGVPGYMVASRKDGDDRGWGHTEADTLDKLDVRDLRENAILLTELVARLANAGFSCPRRPPAEIAAALERQGDAEAMKVTGDWPF
ncbi:M28 family peptidase [Haloarculaceae archaeon H-GB2-1]|nr:M28 family peptidase [Haloarculaceae archaeon H-GB1-1]MEA5385909.1 M28 family peptidase [Haloarculaceae archaeon H-GB11]MEA5407416.1 M28 family peptidase [Haloarculaceae archaeon H-GB2-1]